MKYTQKWMVVPFDKNYGIKNETSDQILKNRILPSDVKSKLYEDLLTRLTLKLNPVKQLPVQTDIKKDQTSEDKKISNTYKTIINKIAKKEITDEEMEIDESNEDYKKKKPSRKIISAKRILNETISQPTASQTIKKLKSKPISSNQKDSSSEDLEDESESLGPAFNTRNSVQTKLNTAQIGKGWIVYK